MKTDPYIFEGCVLRRLLRPLVRALPVAVAIALMGGPRLEAQDELLVGLDAAYEFGLDPARSRSPGFNQWCNCPNDGEMLGHTAWIGATLFHPAFPSAGFGLASSIRFGSASTVFVGRNGDSLEYQEDTRAGMLQLDLMGSVRLGDNFLLGSGPWLAIPLSIDRLRLQRTLPLTSAQSIGPDQPLPPATTAESLGSSYGMIVRGSVPVPLGEYSWLYPEVYVRIDAGRLAANEVLGAFMIGGGTSFMFDPSRFLLPQQPTPQPIPPVVPPPPPAPPTASIAIYALDRNGAKSDAAVIRPRRERHLRSMPVMTAFRFREGSEEFAEPYRIDHRSPQEDIWIDSLAALGPGEIALQGINIIGSRLKAAPEARIKLVAMTVGDEKTAIGVARAKRIRTYLNERWGIEEKRVLIRTIVSRDPLDTVPMVLVVCSDATLATPVEAEWYFEGFEAPRIGLRSDIQAVAGVRRWRLEVRCGDSLVSSYSSDSTTEASSTISFDLGGVDPTRAIAPLVARLVVEDSIGRTFTATDDLPVRLDNGGDTATIGEQVRYILSSKSIDGAAARASAAREIARIVRTGARITLSSYGMSTPNGRASQREMELFAERLRGAVGTSDVSITIDDRRNAAGDSYQGYDIEVAVSQLAPAGG